ncbi:MAG: VOC family protein [Acidimicrobiales bacterium]
MEQRLSLVTLGVRDLTKARAFYEALGWSGAVQPDGDICFFQLGGMVFALWSELGGHGAPGLELAYNVASEAEVQATLDEAVRAGGTILRQATLAVWGGTSGAFADVEGFVWEVAYNPGWNLLEDGSVRL